MEKTIILTGGGTAGHVTPNLALLPYLKKDGYKIVYIGSKNGMEKDLIENAGIEYHGISSGKLRRYFDTKNFSDVFRVVKGIGEATAIIRKLKPSVIFSKGGFVAVPVAVGAFLNGVPFIAHESDMTPGLANKLAIPFAKIVCTTFPETAKNIKNGKGVYTGTPIRDELFTSGDKEKGLKFCGFTDNKPVLLIMGGSQGSVAINNAVSEIIDGLTAKYNVVHLRGKGNLDKELDNISGYRQFEYVNKELKHIFALADMVLSRAGSNAICEFLALNKPMLLIPLSLRASRGDQILNAKSFKAQGFARVIDEDNLTGELLANEIDLLYNNRDEYVGKMQKAGGSDGVKNVMEIINSITKG